MSADKATITIVSGLPRSGTSLMMQMLEAGGGSLLTDGVRGPDPGNPNGYFEYEPVRHLARGCDWIEEARGKALKVIAQLLPELPPVSGYRVVFMRRRLDEVLASQRLLLETIRSAESTSEDSELAASFERDLLRIEAWLAEQAGFQVLDVDHGSLLASPGTVATEVARFLGGGLDARRMSEAVESRLHRQRALGARTV